jgi:hypothetical protein
VSNSPLSLNVGFAVSAPQISSGGVVGGASFSGLSVSAGGILSLFGSGLSTATVSAGSVPLPTTLNNTQVLVNGVAAPLFFVSPFQINFAMPWEELGLTQVQITILSGGVASLSETVPIAPAGPGIFTTNSSGTGQGVVQIAGPDRFQHPLIVFVAVLVPPVCFFLFGTKLRDWFLNHVVLSPRKSGLKAVIPGDKLIVPAL